MKKLILYTILWICIYPLSAQTDLPGFTPTHQPSGYVNINTGAPNINIPVWTVTSGALSVPVSLSYSSQGVRTSELPTEVGLGWKLNAGGSITQIVRGLNDLRQNLFQVATDNLTTDILADIVTGETDSERDYFVITKLKQKLYILVMQI